MEDLTARLQPGAGFHLGDDGQWVTEEIPADVVESARESGRLTIRGYRCTVFETPDLDQWAQKSVIEPGIDVAAVAARVAAMPSGR